MYSNIQTFLHFVLKVLHTIVRANFNSSPTNERFVVNESTLSMDPEDQKWDHFREDTLFHGFHVLLHQIHSARTPANPPSIGVPPESPPRLWEIFWYAHQQQIRR